MTGRRRQRSAVGQTATCALTSCGPRDRGSTDSLAPRSLTSWALLSLWAFARRTRQREMPRIDTKSYQPLLSQQELIILNMIPPDEQIQGSQETAFNAGIFTNYLYIDQISATAITESIIAIFDLFNAIHNFCIIATFLLHKQNLTDHEQLQQNYVKTAHLHVETTRSHQVMLSEAHMSFTDDFNFEHTNQLFTLLANCTNSITANISHCNPSYSTTPTATINYTRMRSHTCTT